MSALATTVSSFLTSPNLPPEGPFAVRMRTQSTTVRSGLTSVFKSAMACPRLPCMAERSRTTPIRFFIPAVTVADPCVLAIGTLMSTSAFRTSS